MIFSHTVKTSASPQRIWEIWTDVKNWSDWDTELIDSYLESPFTLEAKGKLTPKKGGVTTFRISQLVPGKSYTFQCQLPLCSLNVSRIIDNRSDGTYFTHKVWFEGISAFVFSLILGKQFQTVLPTVMENVKRIAETAHKLPQ